jgi:hypothetical protein
MSLAACKEPASKVSALLFMLSVACSTITIYGQTKSPRLAASINAASPTRTGTPEMVTITVTNISDNPDFIFMDKSHKAEFSAKVRVWDSSGVAVRKTKYYWQITGSQPNEEKDESGPERIIVGSPMTVKLEPGRSIESHLNVNELFDISKSGHYSIQVEKGDSTGESVKSNVAAFDIVP